MDDSSSQLFAETGRRIAELKSAPPELWPGVQSLFTTLQEQGKYVVNFFPEYTPHDWTKHVQHLFVLADDILGLETYKRLTAAELVTLTTALLGHDWGMAVSDEEAKALSSPSGPSPEFLLEGEPQQAHRFLDLAVSEGHSKEDALLRYLRDTHGRRSGSRLRRALDQISPQFADAVGRVAEGHTEPTRAIRDTAVYPQMSALFGQTVNLAAVAEYVRIIDLLDIGENRTPFALWKIVQPSDPMSALEWKKHRALSPVAVDRSGPRSGRVVVTGGTDDPDVYAALEELRTVVEKYFMQSILHLGTMGTRYQLPLDTHIEWNVRARGFKPVVARFEGDDEALLELLSSSLYSSPDSWVRELLQNSVDAIDTRAAIIARNDGSLNGRIDISLTRQLDGVTRLDWTDNGVGMDDAIIQHFLARLGVSWYRSAEFRRLATGVDPISRFGVGILSCFGVAHKVSIETRRDPYLAPEAAAVRVDIPSIRSVFRIRPSDRPQVGTTVSLFMRQPPNGIRIRDRLEHFGRRVRVPITFDDGHGPISIGERQEPLGSPLDDETLAPHLERFAVELKGNQRFDAYYEQFLPKVPRKALGLTDRRWELASEVILSVRDFGEETVGRSVFVKGVLADRQPRNASEWLPSSLDIALHNPSDATPTLGRDGLTDINPEIIRDVETQVVGALNTYFKVTDAKDTDSRVAALRQVARFTTEPALAWVELVGRDNWPTLTLGESGLRWKDLGTLMPKGTFFFVPELEFSLRLEELENEESEARLGDWAGPTCVYRRAGNIWQSRGGLETLLGGLSQVLTESGIEFVGLHAAKSGSDDDLPLFVEEWQVMTGEPRLDANASLGILAREMPKVVRFPSGFESYAAIGSVYWNSEHSTIKQMMSVLVQLAQMLKEDALPQRLVIELHRLMSSTYHNYALPSRKAGRKRGQAVWPQIMQLAEEAGCSNPDIQLEDGDFLPGSIGHYANPYHYSTSSWTEGVGTFL